MLLPIISPLLNHRRHSLNESTRKRRHHSYSFSSWELLHFCTYPHLAWTHLLIFFSCSSRTILVMAKLEPAMMQRRRIPLAPYFSSLISHPSGTTKQELKVLRCLFFPMFSGCQINSGSHTNSLSPIIMRACACACDV